MGLKSIRRFRKRQRRQKPLEVGSEEIASIVVESPLGDSLGLRGGYQELMAGFYAEKSEHTIKAYEQDLRAFADFLGTDVDTAVGKLLKASAGEANLAASRWMNSMAEAGRAPATRKRRLNTLKSLTRLARIFGLITWRIEWKGPKKASPVRSVEGPKEDKIHKFFAACGEGLEGQRNELILRLLLRGFRRFEICASKRKPEHGLRLRRYDREGARMRILQKGGEEKWVSLPPNLVECLEQWLVTANVTEPNDPILCAFNGRGQLTRNALETRGFNYVVTELGKRVGEDLWPHAFRHSTATMGVEDKQPAYEIQGFLRHSSLDTTQRYIDNQEARGKEMAEVIDRKFPRDKK